jgi:hypothetical protein
MGWLRVAPQWQWGMRRGRKGRKGKRSNLKMPLHKR